MDKRIEALVRYTDGAELRVGDRWIDKVCQKEPRYNHLCYQAVYAEHEYVRFGDDSLTVRGKNSP
ncbi:hypothetical protein VCR4J5_1510073 [Vibrio crassostreae]|uniref:Uncharacterized protein n=1 Tax=Vibrio crassostreae TaxID=246167 RepID=A0ABM9QPK0_9VIBR|nr:hypothetical protein VCRA211O406_30221 [Vibrio crassostreae]CAK3411354.1 hypothetical protein VCRA2123O443_40223 [Vibrio crassostreae]CDT03933.1 hypothetical protein VCR19J5_1210413 [Vibrio crassostreae]CDT11459.1 hypothetical protein VCR4J5_1510073 [Vibrio crassostreae]